ncbi:ABC transporter ATP-binding isoform A [Micractinium conductrix]|uniref:ABC transporter ATP-binding isoform A n=1 Tax=Micractinium conductrix TaxID=554055 RepID=A0A2P6VGZ3_9CHLO|nr:ABC transporter ATP-binding isoform A [Micractinium conductrix]|eukprot:PSC73338.1 ABC transporter ATP-binding isoform A [Micractinium conductrix]
MHVCSGRTVTALAKKASASVQVEYAGGLVRVFAFRFRLSSTATVATMFILAGAHYSGLRTESVSKKWAPTDLAAASLRQHHRDIRPPRQGGGGPCHRHEPFQEGVEGLDCRPPSGGAGVGMGLLAPPAKPADRGLAMKRIHGYYAGTSAVVNKTGMFDPAKAPAVAVGRSNGGKTTVANKTGMFDPARIQAAKNRRASADPRHCHRVLIVDKQGTVVHFVDVIGATAYQSKSTAAKQADWGARPGLLARIPRAGAGQLRAAPPTITLCLPFVTPYMIFDAFTRV